MAKKIIFTMIFLIGFSMYLSDEISVVNAQKNIQDEYSKITTTTNLTQLFGEPIYKETKLF
ncbi:MAG TPA: hypothetical protein VJ697_12870 [Nitrososphaeraceae archaeon]|nr:hypothetical protein [Nitrososphaeraceae archaeon]